MSIEGTWYNELGSQMNISISGSTISGTYVTAVGSASGTYVLVGQVDTQPAAGGQAAGWTVIWANASGSSHSVTTWSGQYQESEGQEEILTFWLLTAEQLPQNDWAATNVGQDVFMRVQPSQDRINQARKRRSAAHPQLASK